ncbi:MAG: PucR family transcriptional regulator [Actinomycetes bacterium]
MSTSMPDGKAAPAQPLGRLRAPTLRTVLGMPGLSVVLRSGRDALDRPVRWVAVSELEDPTPYLEGGELLLTTGLRLNGRNARRYVERLVAVGVTGLGLGVGLTHAVIPETLLRAADEHGLPVLEVPEPTPFIAISKAVSDLLAAAEYEAVFRAVETQGDLTRAALEPDGAGAVVARLSKELAAQVVLLDPAGRVVHAAPRDARALVEALAPQVERLRGLGAKSSAAFDHDGSSVVLQPLAAAGRVRGYLALARSQAFSVADHQLIGVGVALVSLALERPEGTDTARRDLRDAVFSLLVDGSAMGDLPVAGVGWDEVLAGSVRVLLTEGSPARLLEVLESVEDVAPGQGWRGAARHDGRLVVLVPDVAEELATVVGLGPGLPWGVSDPVLAATDLADGLRQARRALAAAAPDGVRTFGDLAREGVVGLLDLETGRGFADRLLAPLESRERGDLVASVRAWLAHHGQWDAAATSLGVHRHTLRYRMRRVEELLGKSLDDADLRADLWIALAIRDRDSQG